MSAPSKPLRAALYVRVSSAAQSDDGTSLVTQESACRAEVQARGWEVDEHWVGREIHTGGELFERPELTRLRDGMRRHAFDAVVCYSVDRLSRSQIHLGLLLSEAERDGVMLVFVTEPLENTAVGIFLQQARAFAAELEREKIRERSMRGKRARLASGKIFGYGTDLYGYRRDKEQGIRVIEEREAAIVREIYRWVAVEEVGLREARRRLNARDEPPPGAGKFAYADTGHRRFWGTGQLLRMLRNPAYKGETYALRFAADHHKPGRAIFRPPDEWLRLPDGVTPAIVDAATWEMVQKRLDTNRGERARNERRPALLRGHVWCALCGRRMSPERDRNGKMVYRCTSRVAAAGKCGASVTPAVLLDAAVWERVTAILTDPRIIAAGTKKARKRGADGGRDGRRREEIGREIAKIERQQRRLLDRFGEDNEADADDFPWEMVRERVAALQRDLARLREEQKALDIPAIVQQVTVERARGVMEWRAVVASRLDALTFDEKRQALAVLDVRVTANGRAWTIAP